MKSFIAVRYLYDQKQNFLKLFLVCYSNVVVCFCNSDLSFIKSEKCPVLRDFADMENKRLVDL